LAKNLDSCLHWSIDMEVDQPTCRFRIEAKTQGFQNIVKRGGRIHTLTLP
jgi:hypothetical protein